jgi:aminoglycoside phosphotransferase (APT) family kinase protein
MSDDPRSFFPTDRFGEVGDVVVLTQGLSGAAVYSVATAEGEFVLRVQPGDRATWSGAVRMQRRAAERGIAPAIVHVDEARAASVSVKVDGVPFATAVAQSAVRPAAFASILEILARLRAIPLTDEERAASDRGLAQTIWTSQVARPGFPSWATGLGARLDATFAVWSKDPRRVLCHGDLHPANILWDGTRVWLLDWERARPGHPYLDLATLSNFMNLPDDAALGLLGAQERGVVDAQATEVFRALREFGRIVYGAVFLSLVPDLLAFPVQSRDDTPTLGECFQRMVAGGLAPNTPGGQALIGAALLKQAVG